MGKLNDKKLKLAIDRTKDLPPLPKAISKMLAVVNDEHSAAKDLADVISKDPAFTAKVLRIVNSAFYGFSEKISTVTHAVVILGYQNIKDMALGLSVFEILNKKADGAVLDKDRFWQHSLGCASAARLIADYVNYPVPEEAFVAGLLHDVGKIVFDLYLGKDFCKVIDFVKNEGMGMLDAEEKVFGINHTQLGEQVAGKWNLPRTLKAAIRYHHQPLSSKGLGVFDQGIISIIYLADIFCKLKGVGFGGDEVIREIDSNVWSMFNLSDSSSLRIILQIDQEVRKAYSLYGLSEKVGFIEGDEVFKGENSAKRILLIEEKLSPINICWLALSAEGYYVKRVDLENFDFNILDLDFNLVLTDSEKIKKDLTVAGISIPLAKVDKYQGSNGEDFLVSTRPRDFVKNIRELLEKEGGNKQIPRLNETLV
ncbi:MAG TPA: HDOD domain-containing protein [Actinobacteria bacterium]|nr:HDOD domain-containing protein [Actinomycetota bacterium]